MQDKKEMAAFHLLLVDNMGQDFEKVDWSNVMNALTARLYNFKRSY